ncbi:MAG: riboflavin synthase [Deltaproteobacteria bacterium]|nr:riboflavin synthase [Deltaproteobacteria bacterium]
MFTGIIQGLGKITEFVSQAGEVRLGVEAEFQWDEPLALGESISVSGACLTVTRAQKETFSAHVSAETVARTTLGNLRVGHKVNLERALRLSDHLGGHLVTGHVDGMGQILRLEKKGQSVLMTVNLNKDLSAFVVEKGSIAIDGISLTVNQVRPESFNVNIIPHTMDVTCLKQKKSSDWVNLETDLLAKYVASFLEKKPEKVELNKDFLAQRGFL